MSKEIGVRWEYKVLKAVKNFHGEEDALNSVGLRGWENYAVIDRGHETVYYLKRENVTIVTDGVETDG